MSFLEVSALLILTTLRSALSLFIITQPVWIVKEFLNYDCNLKNAALI